ncbi:MAG: F0F1 ATP synthase subunit delta [Proteobacteria bacterium]|nr:F0F1 ATP synthase subunit delta [Pseudomonadota bacterium]
MSAEMIGATGLAGRYATALFDLAESDGLLDRVAVDLDQLGQMIEASADLTRLIRSPVISRDDQGRAMAAVLDTPGMCQLTKNFVGTVAENRRLFALKGMIAAFQALLAAKRGEATADVISVKPLSKKQLDAIGKILKKAIGSKVTIDAKVDESLLGGLIVKIGSRMVDSSLRTKLQQMRFAMKGIG